MITHLGFRFLANLVRVFVIFVSNAQCLNLVPVASSLFSPPKDSQSNSGVLVQFVESNDPLIQSFAQSQRQFSSRTEKNSALTHALQSFSIASQAPVIQALKSFPVQTESYWITNELYIQDASTSALQTIANLPMVKAVVQDLKLPLPPTFNMSIGKVPNGTEWNVKKIKAHKLWNITTGEGIVVGGIDTGVRGTHTALKNNYVGRENHGWHDPFLNTEDPEDNHGHGTHTMATSVGIHVGMAPGAKWMACRGCFLDSCMQHSLLACGQFFLCPGDADKAKKSGKVKCDTSPHVINNSWGGPGGANWYEPVLKAWRAVGIIPVFAMGNSGPKCETLGSPGENEDVIGVGSTDKEDKLSKFSSRGPKVVGAATGGPMGLLGILGSVQNNKTVLANITKPDVCAPGQDINSAHIITDNSYRVLSGTSMACPAVAGAVALLLSVKPDLTYEQMLELFTETTKRKLQPVDGEQCGPVPDDEFPNHMYGYGRINVYKAYKKMKNEMMDDDDEKEDDE